MRRRGGPNFTPPTRPIVEYSSVPLYETNPELWIQLENESRNTTTTLMEIIQQLTAEMEIVQTENENLVHEKD